MTSTNIVFMLHMRNKYYEKLNKIKQDKIKQDKIKEDLDKEDIEYLDKNIDKENLKNCKDIFKNYLEKVSIQHFDSIELQFI